MKFLIYLYMSCSILQIFCINISFKKNGISNTNNKVPKSYKEISLKNASFLKIDEKSLTANDFDELSMFTDVSNLETANSNDLNAKGIINTSNTSNNLSFKEKITDDDITDLLEGDMIKNKEEKKDIVNLDKKIEKKDVKDKDEIFNLSSNKNENLNKNSLKSEMSKSNNSNNTNNANNNMNKEINVNLNGNSDNKIKSEISPNLKSNNSSSASNEISKILKNSGPEKDKVKSDTKKNIGSPKSQSHTPINNLFSAPAAKPLKSNVNLKSNIDHNDSNDIKKSTSKNENISKNSNSNSNINSLLKKNNEDLDSEIDELISKHDQDSKAKNSNDNDIMNKFNVKSENKNTSLIGLNNINNNPDPLKLNINKFVNQQIDTKPKSNQYNQSINNKVNGEISINSDIRSNLKNNFNSEDENNNEKNRYAGDIKNIQDIQRNLYVPKQSIQSSLNLREFDVSHLENLQKLSNELTIKFQNKQIENNNLEESEKKIKENLVSVINQNVVNQAKLDSITNELNLITQLKNSYLTQTNRLKDGNDILNKINNKYEVLSEQFKDLSKKVKDYNSKIRNDIQVQEDEKRKIESDVEKMRIKLDLIKKEYSDINKRKIESLDNIKKTYEDLDSEQIKLLKLNNQELELKLKIIGEENNAKISKVEIESYKNSNLKEIKDIEEIRLQLEHMKSTNSFLKKDIVTMEENIKNIDEEINEKNLELEIKNKELEDKLNKSKELFSNDTKLYDDLKKKIKDTESDLKNKISFMSLQSNDLLEQDTTKNKSEQKIPNLRFKEIKSNSESNTNSNTGTEENMNEKSNSNVNMSMNQNINEKSFEINTKIQTKEKVIDQVEDEELKNQILKMLDKIN